MKLSDHLKKELGDCITPEEMAHYINKEKLTSPNLMGAYELKREFNNMRATSTEADSRLMSALASKYNMSFSRVYGIIKNY